MYGYGPYRLLTYPYVVPGRRSRFPVNISMFVFLLRIWELPIDHAVRITLPATPARSPAAFTI